jgi:hypothetical protein
VADPHLKPLRCVATAALSLAVTSCAAPAPPPAQGPPSNPAAGSFPDDPRPLPRFHSRRLALSLPLPDGRAWRIDDHSQPELVATHAATRSRVLVAVFHTDDLVGRTQCEALARDRKIVPVGAMQTLEEETGLTQQTFDTRTVVAVAPGSTPDQPLVGHVMAFGGFLRKCFVFDFSTEVDGAADEPVLSARLAFARARVLGGLELDPMGAVHREKPVGPEVEPQRDP